MNTVQSNCELNQFMVFFDRFYSILRRSLSFGLLILVACMGIALPAYAADMERYITPDGEDITAMVDCLPQQLQTGNLKRAIAESGKDYLERTFNLKGDSSEYKLTEAEKEYRACLASKGITPVAQ
jgi:hypothetical protein